MPSACYKNGHKVDASWQNGFRKLVCRCLNLGGLIISKLHGRILIGNSLDRPKPRAMARSANSRTTCGVPPPGDLVLSYAAALVPVVDTARSARAPIERSCRLTAITKAALLIASHIKPWRLCRMAQERLEGMNGMMLTLTLICALAADHQF